MWKNETKYGNNYANFINGSFTMSVHYYVGCGKEYFLTCWDLCIEKMSLKTEDLEVAKKKAVQIAREKAQAILNALPNE